METANSQSSGRVQLRISVPETDYRKFRELYPSHGEVSIMVRKLIVEHVKEKAEVDSETPEE